LIHRLRFHTASLYTTGNSYARNWRHWFQLLAHPDCNNSGPAKPLQVAEPVAAFDLPAFFIVKVSIFPSPVLNLSAGSAMAVER